MGVKELPTAETWHSCAILYELDIALDKGSKFPSILQEH